MCRLLAVKDAAPFAITDLLGPFAEIARTSREFQGHGWGCAWWEDGGWRRYRSLTPVWEDDLARFGAARVLLAHARSAFRDEGIEVENNMPFLAGTAAFVFNGELHGVRIREEGRIGAEKLFRFMLGCGSNGRAAGLAHGTTAVRRRTRAIRAMNFVFADGPDLYAYSQFSAEPEYFTMHRKRDGARTVLCSEPFPGDRGWTPLPTWNVEVLE